MRRHLLGLLAMVLACGAWSRAQAQTQNPFTLTGTTITQTQAQTLINTLYPTAQASTVDAAQFMTQWNNQVGTFDATFTQQINSLVNGINYGPITSAFANASSLATKTMSADYASDFELFTLTAGVGTTLHGVSFSELSDQNQFTSIENNQSPDAGVGLNMSIMAGINLGYFNIEPAGWFDPKRLTLFLNVFAYDSPAISGLYDAKVSAFSFGLHGMYRLIDSVSIAPFGLLHWGGLNIGTGFNINNYTVTANHDVDNLNETQSFSFENQTLQLTYQWQGNATVEVTSHNVTIPFEASTNVQLLYFLTLYGGVAVDLNFGSSSASVTSNAPATLTLTNVNTGAKDANDIKPVAHFNLDTPSYGPRVGDVRGWGGAQINIVVLALFGQAQADSSGSWGVNAGLRGFW